MTEDLVTSFESAPAENVTDLQAEPQRQVRFAAEAEAEKALLRAKRLMASPADMDSMVVDLDAEHADEGVMETIDLENDPGATAWKPNPEFVGRSLSHAARLADEAAVHVRQAGVHHSAAVGGSLPVRWNTHSKLPADDDGAADGLLELPDAPADPPPNESPKERKKREKREKKERKEREKLQAQAAADAPEPSGSAAEGGDGGDDGSGKRKGGKKTGRRKEEDEGGDGGADEHGDGDGDGDGDGSGGGKKKSKKEKKKDKKKGKAGGGGDDGDDGGGDAAMEGDDGGGKKKKKDKKKKDKKKSKVEPGDDDE